MIKNFEDVQKLSKDNMDATMKSFGAVTKATQAIAAVSVAVLLRLKLPALTSVLLIAPRKKIAPVWSCVGCMPASTSAPVFAAPPARRPSSWPC